MLIMFIILWGMAIGWVAHLLVGRGRAMSWAAMLGLGLAGSLVGGLLASLIGGDGVQLRASGIVGSIVGAVLLLLVVGWLSPNRRSA